MSKRVTRRPPTSDERVQIAGKTGGRCHVCGGELGKNWCADHVTPKFRGGDCAQDNFLPCCSACNRLRWGYRPETIREILRIGVYMRREIQKGTKLGKKVEAKVAARKEQSRKRASAATVPPSPVGPEWAERNRAVNGPARVM